MLPECINIHIHVRVYKMLYVQCNKVFSTANGSVPKLHFAFKN